MPFHIISLRFILILFSHLGVGLGILEQHHILYCNVFGPYERL